MADYLDQSDAGHPYGDNQAVKADIDRWVGSFKDNFINVLADNIGFLLSTERIYLFPWRVSVINYPVVVDIVVRWPVGRRRLAGGRGGAS